MTHFLKSGKLAESKPVLTPDDIGKTFESVIVEHGSFEVVFFGPDGSTVIGYSNRTSLDTASKICEYFKGKRQFWTPGRVYRKKYLMHCEDPQRRAGTAEFFFYYPVEDNFLEEGEEEVEMKDK